MTRSRKTSNEPLRPEKAALILAGAAIDIDAVAERTVIKLRQLEAGDAGEKLIGATRRAAIALEQAASRLRREGLLGPPDTDIDAVVWRGDKAVRKLEKLDAEPNMIVAARRALDGMHEVARALRRDGFFAGPQQRLL
ncbi:MAG: hypothetical protein ACRDZO_03865 [Egibacteraceae bacterium]